jgi:Bardet-Biedl syndrome 4 protein
LGLVHLNTKQYASAYHYFSVAINLKPDFSNTYMYLGITLNRLGDFDSSCQAFERAMELEKNDCMIYLNFAIVLYNNGKKSEAKV